MRFAPARVEPAEWPRDVLVWLGKAGISPERAYDSYSMGWCPSIDRFLLPCLIDGNPTGHFTCRALDKSRAKYVAGGAGARYWIGGSGRVCCFVEDVLSAVRVSEAGFRACAALGTSFDQSLLSEALRGCTAAVSWLDPDAGGQKGHKALRGAMGLQDVPLYRVQSDRDPKLHSRNEIQNYIGGAISGD